MNVDRSQVETLFHEATELLNRGDLLQSEAVYRQCLAIDPDLAEVHANLAYLLERDGRPEEAESHYLRAIELSPMHTQVLANYAVMLAAKKRFAEAEALYRRALDFDMDSPLAWSNLGVLLASLKREAEAEACYRRALSLDPDYRTAQFNLAYILLRQGRFEEGWQRLEARNWYGQLEALLRCPRWQGEPLSGKTILIGVEAGHGDMIQFCRYARFLKQAGVARVSLLCHPGLKRIFASVAGIDEVIAADQVFQECHWDYWVPPMSLPDRFQTRLDTIPAAIPYLFADSEEVACWSRYVADNSSAFRVGLVWKGNPRFENDADRSLPSLATFSPLWEIPGIRFFSLQKGEGEDEIGRYADTLPLLPLGHLAEDFADTAAMLMNLDLVICVDTAVAHLAGALGKACWMLLPYYKPDWRWLEQRADSPWYPGVMRLFRQEVAGDWRPTIDEVKRALRDRTR